MKANEASEKIYLVITTRIIDEWRKKPSQYGHNIEYTRTDAFIEKACEWLKNNVTYTHPRTGETKCVVNLNAFRDAMKGEMK